MPKLFENYRPLCQRTEVRRGETRNARKIKVEVVVRSKVLESECRTVMAQVEKDPVAKVITAVEGSRWDFRTIEGVAKATGFSEDMVKSILESNVAILRRSNATDRQGRALFTSASRPVRWRERLAAWQGALKADLLSF
jgi:hypothetical protein